VRLLRALRPGGDEDVLADVETVDVLVLDDLAAHKASEWTDEVLYGIVDHRWAHLLPVVVTTNVGPDDPGRMDARLHSRLVGDGAVVLTMAGPDRRRP
jgi:DNA replication protein DnaC